MKKKVLINIWVEDTVTGQNYALNRVVNGIVRNGKTVISLKKVFKSCFGFDLPKTYKTTFR